MGIPMRWGHLGQVKKIRNPKKKTVKNQWPQSGTKGKFQQALRKIHLNGLPKK
jgi:hypothetical protein